MAAEKYVMKPSPHSIMVVDDSRALAAANPCRTCCRLGSIGAYRHFRAISLAPVPNHHFTAHRSQLLSHSLLQDSIPQEEHLCPVTDVDQLPQPNKHTYTHH